LSNKSKYIRKDFESTGSRSDTSANIYWSMLSSLAWKSLTAQQQLLYLYCKAQLYGQRNRPREHGKDCFYMNQAKWRDEFGLYKKGNENGFYRDMEALISKGFIKCVECGATTRTKSVYRYSSEWQRYGSEDFCVPSTDMTLSMRRKTLQNACR